MSDDISIIPRESVPTPAESPDAILEWCACLVESSKDAHDLYAIAAKIRARKGKEEVRDGAESKADDPR